MFNEAVRIYKEHGVKKVLKRAYLRLVRRSALTPVLETVLSPIQYEKLVMFAYVGYWPQIGDPRTYQEHIAHRKFCTDEDLYATVADKWACRTYVERKVGDEILNDVYHVTDDPETIPFDDLPEKFVVKATHASGWNVVVEDKEQVDRSAIRSRCRNWLSTEYGVGKGEYWYGRIKPRVIVERYLEEERYPMLVDFKFHVFQGKVKFIEVQTKQGPYDPVEKEFSAVEVRLYDTDWEPMPIRDHYYPLGPVLEEPDRLDEMVEISERLGEEFDFARVDLYNPNGDSIVFGEITLAPGSGRVRYTPTAFDFEVGSFC